MYSTSEHTFILERALYKFNIIKNNNNYCYFIIFHCVFLEIHSNVLYNKIALSNINAY